MNVRATLLAVLLLVSTGCIVAINWDGPFDAESSETRSFAVGARTDLSVATAAGDVTVVPGTPGSVELVLVRRAQSEADLARLEVIVEHVGSSLNVRVEAPAGLNGKVDIAVTAPADTAVVLGTGSGDVEVSGLTRRATVGTGSGDVEVRNLSGNVVIDTGSGDVVVVGASAGLDVDTGSGDVLARGVRGHTVIQTGSGDVEFEGTPSGASRVGTGSGDVDIELEGVSLAFEISTGSGDIDVRTPQLNGHADGGEMSGRIGAGNGGSLHVGTGSGDVSLSARGTRP